MHVNLEAVPKFARTRRENSGAIRRHGNGSLVFSVEWSSLDLQFLPLLESSGLCDENKYRMNMPLSHEY